MDIVMRRQEMLLLAPNTRWTLPNEVGQQLIDRGAAEEIEADVLQEEKAKAKKAKA
jgi:hypothetical protein